MRSRRGGTEPRAFRLLIQKDDMLDTVRAELRGSCTLSQTGAGCVHSDLLTPILSPRTQ